jgi:hypothetical protein
MMSFRSHRIPVGIGPALAMIDAIDHGDHGHLNVLNETFGPQVLADSVVELTRRLLESADVLGDYFTLLGLHADTHQRNLYHSIDIRRVDRLFNWSPPLVAARGFMCQMLNYYLDPMYGDNDYDDDEDDDEPLPFKYFFLETLWVNGRSHTLGLAYAATWLMSELTSFDGHNFDDVLAAFRSIAAEEMAETI